ncbi:MAG: hypothetical protein IJO48_06080, partial [Clostridia bacterium]|nr:hypothetical protein [Clostridia bacterium]
MIKAVNSGDKNALRKLLKLYSQAIFQRAQSNTGDSTSAKEITRVVLVDIANCASNGTCREDIDAWLMSLTDSRSQEYIAQMQLREAENNRRMAQKQSYFTAPTVSGTVPSSTAYATNHSSIYEREDPFAEEVTAEDEFIPFSPTLTIPECPEFSDRQDECSTQSRTSSITPPSAPYVEPLHAAPFVPPQYVPPQYTPPHASPVIDEIN